MHPEKIGKLKTTLNKMVYHQLSALPPISDLIQKSEEMRVQSNSIFFSTPSQTYSALTIVRHQFSGVRRPVL